MRRILHLADTHIGYSAYRKMDEETGLNQREVDTYRAFKHVINFAVQERPDVIVHAGDLFDSVRPTNRALSFVLEQLIRLSEAGIPFVVISGNHETPRLKETGSVFSLFEHIADLHVVYKNRYERIELDDMTIHAVPHCDDIEREKRKMAVERDGVNIALLHASVLGTGLPAFMMGDFNEQTITIDDLGNFDYVALGHYHRCTQVGGDVWYAGSTERFSFNEVNDPKGFLDVHLGDSSGKEVVFHELKTRAMVDLEPINCSSLEEHEITSALKQRIEDGNPDGKVMRLTVQEMPIHVYHSLDYDELKRLTRSAVHFEIKYEFLRDNDVLSVGRPSFRSLHTEFEHFMGMYNTGSLDKQKLKDAGLKYLQEGDEDLI